MPASEVLDMPSWLKTTLIKKYSRSGKRTPPWRLALKFSPLRNSKSPLTQKNSWQSTWLFSSLHIFCGKQQSPQLFWQTTSPSHVFLNKGNPASTLECVQLCAAIYFQTNTHCWLSRQTLQLISSPDWNSK